MTRDEINALDLDGMRLAVARALGYRYIKLTSTPANETMKVGTVRTRIVCPDNPLLFDGYWMPFWELEELPLEEMMSELSARHVKNWTTDMQAAWELAIEAKISVIPIVDYGTETVTGWIAGEESHMYEQIDYNANWYERSLAGWSVADTAPVAICRAYLMYKAAR